MKSLRALLAALACLVLIASPAGVRAQAAKGSTPPAAPTATPAPAEPAAVPLGEVASRSEEALTQAREAQEEANADRTDDAIASDLRALTRDIDNRLAETRKLISRTSSIDALTRVERPWQRLGRVLSGWSRTLAERIAELEQRRSRLDDMAASWRATLDEARKTNAPAEVIRRIQDLSGELTKARDVLERERARALAVQSRVAIQQARVAEVISATRRARRDVEDRLFMRDSAPIWSAVGQFQRRTGLAAESQGTLASQWEAVEAYSDRQPGNFLAHGLMFLGIAMGLVWIRTRARRWIGQEPALADTAAVFEVPVAMALLLSILGGFWIYPDAPLLWLSILGALALIPAMVILRHLIDRDVLPVMYTLVIFYFVDQLRAVAAPVELVPRLMLTTELLAAAGVAAWLGHRMRRTHTPDGETRRRRYIRRASYAALGFALFAAGANAFGYVALGTLVGNALFSSAYVGLMFYAFVEVVEGLFLIALHARPLTLFASVRNHRMLLAGRVRRVFEWIGIIAWLLFLVQRLALRDVLFESARDVLVAEAAMGSIRVSLGDVLSFIIVVWASFLVSRFVRFLLEEEVYPRFTLARGLPYAISNTIHYLIVVVGFFVAVGALGFDMTKFTILAGAFTVGVGFGLQNIFNNFVSGLILLFERPIKVGDVIQLDDGTQALVERIGIRASIVRVSSGPEIIVPNGKLISERVINWTLHGRQRSIEVLIALQSSADWKKALQILERVGREHPLVLKSPAPSALVTRMGPDFWSVDLRVWTDHPEDWMEIRSEIGVAAGEAMKAEGIAVR